MDSKTYKEYEPEELRPGINITDNQILAKEAGKAATKVAGPVGVAYTVLDFFRGSPANEGEEEALRAMKNKTYNKSFKGPLSKN